MQTYPGELGGVRDTVGLASALARPAQAVAYADADLALQAATLLFGLIKNHPFVHGNKRTAWTITEFLVRETGSQITAANPAILEMVYKIATGDLSVDEIAAWFRKHLTPPAEEKPHGE
jgi:death-on-curing protein